jgi:hypothetical protein
MTPTQTVTITHRGDVDDPMYLVDGQLKES